jgi:pantoate--beta-alanine ligase
MGAFHEGHLSLMRAARARCAPDGLVVVSLFVNPTQFDEAADLTAYPRDEAGDAQLAEDEGVDVLFVPPPEEVYPDGFRTTVHVAGVTETLEGAHRPGHFDGVATVVAKLFSMAQPDVAFFGGKDAQQAAMIRRLARDLDLAVEIDVRPIVREPDGLALSSRNRFLTSEQREAATCLFLALSSAAELARAGERDATVLVAAMAREIGATPQARIDYVAVVDDATFEEVRIIAGPARALVAAGFGDVRLIDTLLLPTP